MTKKTLLNERVIRRWGKLAAMPALTENFLDTITEEEEEMEVAELEADGGEEEMMSAEVDMDGEADVQMSEEDAEKLVAAIADAVSSVTGVEGDGESEEEEMGDMMDMEADEEVEALADDEAPMGMDHAYNRQDETLDVEVVDDEELTEAVLQRVVERLLARK